MSQKVNDDYVKEKINSWFMEEGNQHSIRTFLKSLILQKINEEDLQINLKLSKATYDNIDVSIAFLVADFFLHNHFHYSLSVFSSEIFSTDLKDYVLDYFNKISCKWDPRRLPTLDYPTVYNILLSLNINPTKSLGADIISRYYLMSEEPLLKIIISLSHINNITKNEQLSLPITDHENVDKFKETEDCRNLADDLKAYFDKKETNLYRKISFQKQEFARSRKLLSSCHETLQEKLDEVYHLINKLSSQKWGTSEELSLLRKHELLISVISDKLDILSSKLDEIKELDKPEVVSNAPPPVIETVDSTRRSVSCQTELNSRNIGCQAIIQHKEEGTDTDSALNMSGNIETQTEFQYDCNLIQKLEEEKMELILFIEQQQERINILTEKTIALNNIIISAQSLCSEKAEPHHDATDVHGKSLNIVEQCNFRKLEKIIDSYSFCIETITKRMEIIKTHSEKIDEKLNSYLEKDKQSS